MKGQPSQATLDRGRSGRYLGSLYSLVLQCRILYMRQVFHSVPAGTLVRRFQFRFVKRILLRGKLSALSWGFATWGFATRDPISFPPMLKTTGQPPQAGDGLKLSARFEIDEPNVDGTLGSCRNTSIGLPSIGLPSTIANRAQMCARSTNNQHRQREPASRSPTDSKQ